MNLQISNGRIVDPANNIDFVGSLSIRGGVIESVKKGKTNAKPSKNNIDASGLIVCPGLIDMHVHLRDPGQEYKEDIETGSQAAAKGGVTSVACMANTDPVNDNPSVTEYIIKKAEKIGLARVMPIAAISKGLMGKELTEFGALKEAGAVAFSDDGVPTNSRLMRRALEYASQFDMPIIDHCEDPTLSQDGVMHEGEVSSELGLKGWPVEAESTIIHRNVHLAALTGGRIHMCHMTSKQSVEQLRLGKKMGAKVSGEVTPHHLFLGDDLIRTFDTKYKVNPPIRSQEHIRALRQGLKQGVVDVIATDHAPHAAFEKQMPFESAPFGMLGLQTMLPLTLELVEKNILSLSQAIAKMTIIPAQILNVPLGSFTEGHCADVTVFDPKATYKLSVDDIVSKSKNSPFLDRQLKGKVVRTILGGKTVFAA